MSATIRCCPFVTSWNHVWTRKLSTVGVDGKEETAGNRGRLFVITDYIILLSILEFFYCDWSGFRPLGIYPLRHFGESYPAKTSTVT